MIGKIRAKVKERASAHKSGMKKAEFLVSLKILKSLAQ
jgi:hypothetical protein